MDAVVHVLRGCVHEHPSDVDLHLVLAEALVVEKQYPAAKDSLEPLRAVVPADLRVLGSLARLAAMMIPQNHGTEYVEGIRSATDAFVRRARASADHSAELDVRAHDKHGAAEFEAAVRSAYDAAWSAAWTALRMPTPPPARNPSVDLEVLLSALDDRMTWSLRPRFDRLEPKSATPRPAVAFTTDEGEHREGIFIGNNTTNDRSVFRDLTNETNYWVRSFEASGRIAPGAVANEVADIHRWRPPAEIQARLEALLSVEVLEGLSANKLRQKVGSHYEILLGGGVIRRLLRGETLDRTDLDLVGTAPLGVVKDFLVASDPEQKEARLESWPPHGMLRLFLDHPKDSRTGLDHLKDSLTGLDYVLMRAGGAYEAPAPLSGTHVKGAPLTKRPLVVGADPRYHAATCDFTANALLYDPTTREIYDPTGLGIHDARQGLLRLASNKFVHQNRKLFTRALKFQLASDFRLEAKTRELLLENARHFRDELGEQLLKIAPRFRDRDEGRAWLDRVAATIRANGADFLLYEVPSLDRLMEIASPPGVIANALS